MADSQNREQPKEYYVCRQDFNDQRYYRHSGPYASRPEANIEMMKAAQQNPDCNWKVSGVVIAPK